MYVGLMVDGVLDTSVGLMVDGVLDTSVGLMVDGVLDTSVHRFDGRWFTGHKMIGYSNLI